MSFGSIKLSSGVLEALVLALMIIAVFTFMYGQMELIYKVGIVIIAFAIIFLATLATQILMQQKQALKQAQT
jgi:hypothetical protein